LGLERSQPDLRGGGRGVQRRGGRKLLSGATGPVRDAVLLNAGAALAAHAGPAGRHRGGLHEGLRAGIETGRPGGGPGAASAALARWVALAQEIRAASDPLTAPGRRRTPAIRAASGPDARTHRKWSSGWS